MRMTSDRWLLSATLSILLLGVCAATAADVQMAAALKGQRYRQIAASTVALGDDYAELNVYVTASSEGAVSAVSLLLPNFTLLTMPASDAWTFSFSTNCASLSDLDRAFPNGQYVLRMTGVADGFHGVPVSLASNTTPLYPPTPVVSNFDAAQNFDAASAFTLTWNAFSNGTASEFIKLTIRNTIDDSTVYQTSDPGQPGALNGLSTSVEIPPNTLPADLPLEGELVFARAVTTDFTTYPGALCLSSFYKRTTFPLAPQRTPDVLRAGVRKGLHYAQTSATTVTPQTGKRAARFAAYAALSADDSLASAQVLLPDFTIQTLAPTDSQNYSYSSNCASLAALDQAFPNGQYVLMLTANHDGYRPVPVYLTNNAYPNVPRALNFDQAQAVDPASDFTLSWEAFTNGTAGDAVQVIVNPVNSGSVVWKTPDAGHAGALSGLTTAVTIPAYSLPPGQSLLAQIIFAKIVYEDDHTYPGVPCVAVYYTVTAVSIATTGEADTDPPWLKNSDPSFWEDGIPRNSGLALSFSEPMQPAYSITWVGVTNEFTCAWSADRTVLFCTTPGLLPANATVGYVLNPSAYSPGFRDLAGNPLPTDFYGQFQTGEAVATPDVEQYSVHKAIAYMQTNAAAPVYDTNQYPFLFGADVELNVPAGVTEVTLRREGGADQPVSLDHDFFGLEAGYSTSNNLRAAYPDGDYTLTMKTTHDGVRAATLSLSGNDFPPAPRVANWTAAQVIDPAANFTLTWDPFASPGASAMIQLEINVLFEGGDEDVISTPDPGRPGVLPPSTTSYVIPAGTLSPGRTYAGQLMFVNLTQSNTAAYPGALGIAGYATMTRFLLACVGAPIRPVLHCRGIEDGFFKFRLTGVPNVPYTIEVTDSLDSGVWQYLMSQNSADGIIDFQDWDAVAFHANRFYRAREGW